VQKAPAATIGQLARILKQLFRSSSEIKIIGTRHGEKKHESLLNREEMVRSIDLGEYYRVPSDMRGLDYAKFFEQGEDRISTHEDYTSENTHRLTDEELKEMLLSLNYVQNELSSCIQEAPIEIRSASSYRSHVSYKTIGSDKDKI
jgi:UDP-glucose 4-epimerase